MYVIRHVAHRDMFWSNRQGWVDYASATRFAQSERDTLNLPIEGEWIVPGYTSKGARLLQSVTMRKGREP